MSKVGMKIQSSMYMKFKEGKIIYGYTEVLTCAIAHAIRSVSAQLAIIIINGLLYGGKAGKGVSGCKASA